MITHRARDIHKCLKGIGSFTNDQAKVVSWDSDHLEWITIQITPKEGPYCGGKYDFMITFGKSYPKQPPQVDCTTPIYHPNIDMTGDDFNVCLSLFDEWQSSFGLEDVIQGILFLMYNPNLEDPLSPWFDPSMNAEEFKENLQKTLRGQVIEDAINYEFPKMIDSESKVANEGEKIKDEVNKNEDEDSNKVVTTDNTASIEDHNIDINSSVESNQPSIDTQNSTNDEKEGSENVLPSAIASTVSIALTDHGEIADYIEDTFLTGFGELLAIDINSDCNSDESNTDYSDDESYYVPDNDSEVSSTFFCEDQDNGLSRKEHYFQYMLNVVKKLVDVINSAVELNFTIEIINGHNDQFTKVKTEHAPIDNMVKISSESESESESNIRKNDTLSIISNTSDDNSLPCECEYNRTYSLCSDISTNESNDTSSSEESEDTSSDSDDDLIVPGLFDDIDTENDSECESFHHCFSDCGETDTDIESDTTIVMKSNNCDNQKQTFFNIIMDQKYDVTRGFLQGYCSVLFGWNTIPFMLDMAS